MRFVHRHHRCDSTRIADAISAACNAMPTRSSCCWIQSSAKSNTLPPVSLMSRSFFFRRSNRHGTQTVAAPASAATAMSWKAALLVAGAGMSATVAKSCPMTTILVRRQRFTQKANEVQPGNGSPFFSSLSTSALLPTQKAANAPPSAAKGAAPTREAANSTPASAPSSKKTTPGMAAQTAARRKGMTQLKKKYGPPRRPSTWRPRSKRRRGVSDACNPPQNASVDHGTASKTSGAAPLMAAYHTSNRPTTPCGRSEIADATGKNCMARASSAATTMASVHGVLGYRLVES
mmetsp:Transcript_36193/g.99770  ORF Transcript_36193/g.99770 Transcript_36193/m.99770 type:complete len:291 (-) Transcript_36193:203-1075(-)